jgi:hypothetical protein
MMLSVIVIDVGLHTVLDGDVGSTFGLASRLTVHPPHAYHYHYNLTRLSSALGNALVRTMILSVTVCCYSLIAIAAKSGQVDGC